MSETREYETDKTATLWLENFSSAVRERNYERGRQLFAPEVFAFGTYSAALDGLEALEADQWRHIWSTTRNFIFDVQNMKCSGNDNLIWIAVLWQSQGQASHEEWFERRGRASFVIEHRGGQWLAIHSHHSLIPTPNSTFLAVDNL